MRCNLKFAGLVIVLLPVLLALGGWQLWRADEKERALLLHAEINAAGAVPLADLSGLEGEALDGRRVELRGSYLAERSFLLDNRMLQGRVGYELISGFRDASGALVLVNRGWMLAPPTRDRLPEFVTPGGELGLQGEVHVPRDRRRIPASATSGWPSVVQAVDVAALGRHAGYDVLPFLVRLDAGQPGTSEADWPRVNMPPERHVAYAVQWFLMAGALLVVFVLGGTNLIELRRRKQERNEDSTHGQS